MSTKQKATPKLVNAVAVEQPQPILTGSLRLITGVFNVRSKRIFTLWPKKIQFSSPSGKGKIVTVQTIHAHVISCGEDRFILRDSAVKKSYTFIASDRKEKGEWIEVISEAIQARHAARRAALDSEQARIKEISERLGLSDVVIGTPAPPVLVTDEEAKKFKLQNFETASSADDSVAKVEEPVKTADSSTTENTPQVSIPTKLSQDIQNAANACGVDPATIHTLSQNQSGIGHTRLIEDVYWYEVQPNDTLTGICLRFDAQEASVRRYNFLAKRQIHGTKVLRIPRSCTANPTHDYSGQGNRLQVQKRATEDPGVRRQRTENFKIHIMVLLSAQRALKEEHCFTPNEARAYLNLHDHDLNRALDAMEQDIEWDEKHGEEMRALWKERVMDCKRSDVPDLGKVIVDPILPAAADGSAASETIELREIVKTDSTASKIAAT